MIPVARLHLIFLAALLVASSAYAAKPLTNMPLAWSPTSEIHDADEFDLTGVGSIKVQLATFADERPDRKLIGENREDESKRLPVSTPDDVPVFVTQGLREVLGRVGLRIVETEGDVILSGALRRFFAVEKSTYEGELAVWVTAKDSAGKLLWEGVVTGTSTRWGRSYKAENYCEVLSDAVFDAAFHLMQNPSFFNALREAK